MAAVFPDGEDTSFPLGLELGIESLQPDTVYTFVEEESTRDGENWASLTYRRALSNGLQVTRKFELSDEAFGMRASVEVVNQSNDRIRLPDVRLLLPGSLRSDAGGGLFGGSGSPQILVGVCSRGCCVELRGWRRPRVWPEAASSA